MPPVLPSLHVTLIPCCIVLWQPLFAARLIQNACSFGASIRDDLRLTTHTRYLYDAVDTVGQNVLRLNMKNYSLVKLLQLWSHFFYCRHWPAQHSDQCTGGRRRRIQSTPIFAFHELVASDQCRGGRRRRIQSTPIFAFHELVASDTTSLGSSRCPFEPLSFAISDVDYIVNQNLNLVIPPSAHFGKSKLQVPDTGTSQYWWILEHFWRTSIAWKYDIYVL